MVGYFIQKLKREQNLKVFGICFYLLSEIAWGRSVCLLYSFTLLTSLLLLISLMFNVDVLVQEVSKPWVSSHLLTFTETFVAFFFTHLLSKSSSPLKKTLKVLKIIPDELHMNRVPLVNPCELSIACISQQSLFEPRGNKFYCLDFYTRDVRHKTINCQNKSKCS